MVRWDSMDSLLNVFLIVFEIPMLGNSEYLELALHMLCKALSCVPVLAQAKLARVWAKHCKSRLPNLLQALQELITVKVHSLDFFNSIYFICVDLKTTCVVSFISLFSQKIWYRITGNRRILHTRLLRPRCGHYYRTYKSYENFVLCEYVGW